MMVFDHRDAQGIPTSCSAAEAEIGGLRAEAQLLRETDALATAKAKARANTLEADLRLANRNTATASEQRDTARADAGKLRYNLALAWAHIHARLHQPTVPKERCGEAMCRKLREAVDHG